LVLLLLVMRLRLLALLVLWLLTQARPYVRHPEGARCSWVVMCLTATVLRIRLVHLRRVLIETGCPLVTGRGRLLLQWRG